MKKLILLLISVTAIAVASHAQDIAVQTVSGSTLIFYDFNKAILEAPSGSTIFLPAGTFNVSDTVKIKKKLTIVGVGHRPDTEGGNTLVSGNIHLQGGSGASAVMGIHLTGNINIADSEQAVSNIVIRYCNVNSIQVDNSGCSAIIINQNYIRSSSRFGNASAEITNNVCSEINNLNNGIVNHNIIEYSSYNLFNVRNSIVTNNFGKYVFAFNYSGVGSQDNNNLAFYLAWPDIFIDPQYRIDPRSDFHLKTSVGKEAATDGTDIGIYGGTGFSDKALPPYPQIVFKNIPGQTDEFGNLKIQIKVKANSNNYSINP